MIGSDPDQIVFSLYGVDWEPSETYPEGTILYLVAHCCSNYRDVFTDQEGNTIYPTINPTGSNVDSYQVPVLE